MGRPGGTDVGPHARYARCPPRGQVSPLGRPGGTDVGPHARYARCPPRGQVSPLGRPGGTDGTTDDGHRRQSPAAARRPRRAAGAPARRNGRVEAVRRHRQDAAGARLPGRARRRLAGEGDRPDGRAARQVPLAQGLHGRVRPLRRVRGQVPLLHRHAGSAQHAGRAAGPDAQRLPALFHAAGQVLPRACRRARPDEGRAGPVVQLLQPVLGVPALLGVLPVRHRHRRSHDGREGDHGRRRSRAEVQQRDHRQGAPDRQQPRAARAGARRHAGRPRGGREGGDGRGRPLPAGREGRRGAAGHAVRRLLRGAARRQPDRLRQGVPRGRHPLDAVVARVGGRQLRPLHRQLRPAAEDRAAHPRGRARARRQAHRRRRVRPRVARRVQLLEHADRHRRRRRRPVRADAPAAARFAVPPADAHLRAHVGPDRARRAPVRQGRQRRPRRHLPRLVQRRARVADGRLRRAGSSRFRARSSARSRTSTSRCRAARRASRRSAAAAAAAC